ncbi:unnamed protein product [Cylicocyclus nassatus]|uniref:Uncharacterized protein n=1 Tax=Cylicocyclus nassatus TaxID=53992 RepID=A0AA36M1R9_CYLNA|nr:unnamed protein product [Cylicocyclus nassatus]
MVNIHNKTCSLFGVDHFITMFLSILPLLLDAACASPEGYWGHTQKAVPAKFRLGNRYYIDVDNIGNYRIFEPIAIYLDATTVAFGKFKEDSDCVIFGTPRTVLEKCNHEYFLLTANYYYYERRPLYEAMRDKPCEYFKIRNYVLVLIKDDVKDPKSVKYVGTYSVKADAVYYTDKEGKRNSFKRLLVQIKSGDVGMAKIEVLSIATIRSLRFIITRRSTLDSITQVAPPLHSEDKDATMSSDNGSALIMLDTYAVGQAYSVQQISGHIKANSTLDDLHAAQMQHSTAKAKRMACKRSNETQSERDARLATLREPEQKRSLRSCGEQCCMIANTSQQDDSHFVENSFTSSLNIQTNPLEGKHSGTPTVDSVTMFPEDSATQASLEMEVGSSVTMPASYSILKAKVRRGNIGKIMSSDTFETKANRGVMKHLQEIVISEQQIRPTAQGSACVSEADAVTSAQGIRKRSRGASAQVARRLFETELQRNERLKANEARRRRRTAFEAEQERMFQVSINKML